MKVRLDDRFTIHGSSYVRPPIQPIPLRPRLHDQRHRSPGADANSCAWTRPATARAACRICCKQDDWLAGVQRRRDARRGQDAHLVRHRMGLRLRRRHPGAAKFGRSPGRLPSPRWLLPVARPGRQPARQAQLPTFGEKLERLEKLYVRGYGVEGGFASPTRTRSRRRPSCRTSGRCRPTCSSSSARTSGPTSA